LTCSSNSSSSDSSDSSSTQQAGNSQCWSPHSLLAHKASSTQVNGLYCNRGRGEGSTCRAQAAKHTSSVLHFLQLCASYNLMCYPPPPLGGDTGARPVCRVGASLLSWLMTAPLWMSLTVRSQHCTADRVLAREHLPSPGGAAADTPWMVISFRPMLRSSQ
jgi:hypothetical protein